ncbi:hypothetical protein QL285_003308 [Trifolium repens]|nr:hypothetical protein QL285_003308 [Trifolium repens]
MASVTAGLLLRRCYGCFKVWMWFLWPFWFRWFFWLCSVGDAAAVLLWRCCSGSAPPELLVVVMVVFRGGSPVCGWRCFGGGVWSRQGGSNICAVGEALWIRDCCSVYSFAAGEVKRWWWCVVAVSGGGCAEAFLGLGSCPGAPDRARTFGVAEGCSSLLRFAGLWYLVELYCIRC